MFDFMTGIIDKYDTDSFVLNVQGIGYRIQAAERDIQYFLQQNDIRVYLHMVVREDGMFLYGFSTEFEREMFYKLLSVQKVGPKVALSILSAFSPDELMLLIIAQDAKALSKANGVGKKTAEQIVFALKDKFDKLVLSDIENAQIQPGLIDSENGLKGEALEALEVLGFERSYGLQLINQVYSSELSVEQIIAKALSIADR